MIRHRIIRTLCCLPLLLPAACEHPDGNELFTEVSIRLVMPDSRPVERLEILTDISYFYNLNTYERTAFPETVERNRTTVRLRRGIYNFIVEARATYADGTTRRITLSGSPSALSGSTSAPEGQPAILIDGKPFHGDLSSLSPDRIARITVYKGASLPEEYRQYVGSGTQGLIVIESRNPTADTTSVPRYNTIVGGRGGMVVTGPEVMSKSRDREGRPVTIARGRVTADFSEIDEADYRIEIDGRPAAMADLKRIEPGKIRRVETTPPDAASGRKGILRVRTRR